MGFKKQQTASEKFASLWELARWDRREHWLLCLPAVWGTCISYPLDGPKTLVPFIQAVATTWAVHRLLHGLFCVWNDICDVEFDKQVERTKRRPLCTGRVTIPEALLQFTVMSACTVALILYAMGPEALVVSIPLWILAAIYPFMKRVTHFPQFILAIPHSWPIFISFAAVTGHAGWSQSLPLFAANYLHVVYYDSVYGCQDYHDDVKAGVKSTAVLMGSRIKHLLLALAALIVTLLWYSLYRSQSSPLLSAAIALGAACNFAWQLKTLSLANPATAKQVFISNQYLDVYIAGGCLARVVLPML